MEQNHQIIRLLEWPAAAVMIAAVIGVVASVLRYVKPAKAKSNEKCNLLPEQIPGLAEACRQHNERMSAFDTTVAVMEEQRQQVVQSLDDLKNETIATRASVDHMAESLGSWFRKHEGK